MSLYVGEAVRVRAEAIDPDTGSPLDPPPLTSEVVFWAPGKNPIRNLDDRNNLDHGPLAMEFRESLGLFEVFVLTEGSPWEAGRWTFRVKVVGEHYTNWEYGTFTLKA